MSNLLKYSIDQQIISTGKTISGGEGCNGLIFINLGTNIANIELLPLSTGQQFAIDGNIGEEFFGNVNINFTDSGGTNSLLIIRKVYL